MEKLIGNFQKNKFEEVRVQIKEYKGYDLIDIRVYASAKEGAEKVPTAKGISINVSHFQDLKKALLDTEKVLKENNLLTE